MESIDFFNSIVAGMIQGVSELFPVSSSGHLLLFSHLTNLHLEIAEIAILHLGTFIAIVIGMWDKIKEIKRSKTLLNIVVATIPGGVIGFILKDWISENLGESWIIAISLMFWGGILILVDQSTKSRKFKTSKIGEVTTTQAIIVGTSQILAFVPGTSRAGIAIISGILSGIEPKTAIEFSFLVGLILIPGAGILSIIEGIDPQVSTFCIATATIVSATIGIIVIRILRKYTKRRILTFFGFYRIIIGILILLFV